MFRLIPPILRRTSTTTSRTIHSTSGRLTTATTAATTSGLLLRHNTIGNTRVATVTASSCSIFVQQQQQKRPFVSKQRHWREKHDSSSDIEDDDDAPPPPSQAQAQQVPHHGLEPETSHTGIVRRLTTHGVFVQIAGCPVHGFVHRSEMSDSYVSAHDVKDFVTVGEKVTVVVLENEDKDDTRLRLSMRLDAPVKPALPDNFHPVTVIAFGVPVDVNQCTLEKTFGRYGQVINIDELPMEDYDATKRPITKITFLNQAAADACLKDKQVRIPYDIGDKTYHATVRVRLCRYQNYQEQLLKEMYVKYNVQKLVREERQIHPRILSDADRHLREVIPYYDDWKRSERETHEAILLHDPLSRIRKGR